MMHLDLYAHSSNRMDAVTEFKEIIIGVAAKNCNTTNYSESLSKIRRNERFLLHFETGAAPERIYFLNQKHENEVISVDSPCETSDLFVGDADALITDQNGLCLVIRTADCVPVMLYDPESKSIAAVHSGWRSTRQNIIGKTVQSLKDKYGVESKNLHAYILPSIRQESYEVGEDVAKEFEGHYSEKEGKYYLDLNSAIEKQLLEEGLPGRQVFASFYDTYANNDLFFSHRKGDTGRNLNFIIIR